MNKKFDSLKSDTHQYFLKNKSSHENWRFALRELDGNLQKFTHLRRKRRSQFMIIQLLKSVFILDLENHSNDHNFLSLDCY